MVILDLNNNILTKDGLRFYTLSVLVLLKVVTLPRVKRHTVGAETQVKTQCSMEIRTLLNGEKEDSVLDSKD